MRFRSRSIISIISIMSSTGGGGGGGNSILYLKVRQGALRLHLPTILAKASAMGRPLVYLLCLLCLVPTYYAGEGFSYG